MATLRSISLGAHPGGARAALAAGRPRGRRAHARTGSNARLDERTHEVVLTLTITAQAEQDNAFLVEVQQAGIFNIEVGSDDELKRILGSMCPNILFPYAREAVDNLVTRGGFPPLMLAPINFDALFAQALQQQKTQQPPTPPKAH